MLRTVLRLAIGWSWSVSTWAGPPFITDDPEPVDPRAWEINYAITATHAQGQTSAAVPQIDINYGAAPGLQLHVMPQRQYSNVRNQHGSGIGDTEVGVKYRLTAESDDPADWMISVYPLYETPTGNADRNLGAGNASIYLPVWVQTTRGRWLSFGGGGYWINSGNRSRNGWAGGYCAMYQVTDALQLGGEVFAKTPSVIDGRRTAGFNVGGDLALGKNYALLFSAGRGLINIETTNQASMYFGLRASY